MTELLRSDVSLSPPKDYLDGCVDFIAAASPQLGVAAAEPHVLAKGGFYQRRGKRLIDVLGAAALLLVAAPIMGVVAIAVRLSLGRGVIFRQQRVGLHGDDFTVYKFRTMRVDRRTRRVATLIADRRACHKTAADPRLTTVGRSLRRWSLDELPQLWNVLRGDMSLVGPRPELKSIVDGYQPWQRSRHVVKPGLTGYWQIRERGGGKLMHECTALDVKYVHDIGLLTDLKILLLTLPAVLGIHRGY